MVTFTECVDCFERPVSNQSRRQCGRCYQQWRNKLGGNLVARGFNTGLVKSGTRPKTKSEDKPLLPKWPHPRFIYDLGCVRCKTMFRVPKITRKDIQKGKQQGCHSRIECEGNDYGTIRGESAYQWASCRINNCRNVYRAKNNKSVQCGEHPRSEVMLYQYHNDMSRKANVYAAVHRRHARVKDQHVEDVDIRVLYERDGGKCGLCGKQVRLRSTRKRDPKAASIDHIIPISQDGENSYANTQLTHWGCNLSKGDRPRGSQLRLIG